MLGTTVSTSLFSYFLSTILYLVFCLLFILLFDSMEISRFRVDRRNNWICPNWLFNCFDVSFGFHQKTGLLSARYYKISFLKNREVKGSEVNNLNVP